jgi:hypothetical protein
MKKSLTVPLLMALLLLVFAAPRRSPGLGPVPVRHERRRRLRRHRQHGPSGRYNEPALAASLGVQCMHLTGGDGFATMGDGRSQYIFGFADVTGIP